MNKPFDDKWKKAMFRLSKKQLEEEFGISSNGLKKEDFINIIRANLIVNEFNKKYKIGDKILWKPVASFGFTPVEVTLKEKAFLNYGNPVAFFKERSGFCSIEPQHLIIKNS
jgi:hypothetical protein